MFTRLRYRHTSITLHFILRDGTRKSVCTPVDRHILQIAKENHIELEGACEASLACSTCHVILPENLFHKITAAKDEEEDLLDLAFGLTRTSRLGCQVFVNQEWNQAVITLPKASRNLYVDGTKPASH